MACAECGWTQGHAPACALGQVTGPLQQINSGVGALVAGQAEGFAGVQNELALGNVAAFAQLSIQTQELAALGEINGLLQQQAAMQQRQMLEQQRQAALQQLLFETELFVRKVDQVATRDGFAAGVMSALRLEGLKAVDVGPHDFTAIEHKRALQVAVDRLTAAWSGLAGADVERGRSFVRTFLELVRLLRGLGDLQTVATVKELEAEMARRVDQAGRDVKLAISVLLAGPVSLVLGFVLAVHSFDAGNVVGSLAGFGLMIASPFVVVRSIGFLRGELASRRRARRQADAVAAYKAFVERADGGGLLAGVFEKHVALRP